MRSKELVGGKGGVVGSWVRWLWRSCWGSAGCFCVGCWCDWGVWQWRGWRFGSALWGEWGGRGVNLRSRLKCKRSCGWQADVAHGAEDSFDSRPVRAEIRQLSFEGLAEVDRGLSCLVVCELRVDQGE